MFSTRIILGLLTAAVAAAQSYGAERYYVLIFGSQRVPPIPKHAHTFAVFVRSMEREEAIHVDYHTISWLPESGTVKVKCWKAEKGRNYGLYETLEWAMKDRERISMWGPFEITKKLFERSKRQHKKLDSGKVRYKAADIACRDGKICNCIHAVSALCSIPRYRFASPCWGETASWFVAVRMRLWMIEPKVYHDWLIDALDLGRYPIIYRDMRFPRSGPLSMLVHHACGMCNDRIYTRRIPAATTVGRERDSCIVTD